MTKETPVTRFTITVEYRPFKGEKTNPEFVRDAVESLARTRMNHNYTDGSLVRFIDMSEGGEVNDEYPI